MPFRNAQGQSYTNHGLTFHNPGQEGISTALRNVLETAGAFLGRPLGIISGHRDPAHNARVGGAPNSWHTRGGAADIDLSGMSTGQRQTLVQNLIGAGAGGLGMYSNSPNMLHVDMRPQTDGQAWFMFNRSNSNMSAAPSWFQNLQGSQGTTQQAAMQGPQGNEIPQITVYANDHIDGGQSAGTNLLNNLFGPSPFNYQNENYIGDENMNASGIGQFLGVPNPMEWLADTGGRVLFIIIGLVILAAGLFLITRGETTLNLAKA